MDKDSVSWSGSVMDQSDMRVKRVNIRQEVFILVSSTSIMGLQCVNMETNK